MALDPTVTWRRVEASSLDLRGLNAAVVGGTGGLGRAISRALASRGASVLVVGQTFRDADVTGIEFVGADLSSIREARRVARALPAESLDLLVFTTGIFAAARREETSEGLERDMAVSYLSRLVMIREMTPRLRERRPGVKPRVFVMGYPGGGQIGSPDDLNAERSYGSFAVHMNTVAGNEMLVLDAVGRYPNANFFGLNPGIVRTNIRANRLGGPDALRFRVVEWLIGLFSPTPETYAERVAPLLVTPDIETRSGAMFDHHGRAIRPSAGLEPPYVAAFLSASESLVARALSDGGAP